MSTSSYEHFKLARASTRPTATAYIDKIFDKRIELHGDRRFADDEAITGGIGFVGGIPVTYIGIEKGTDLASRISHNFGCPKPEGYRKALRLMKQAEKFRRPIVCMVDTMGAFCGVDAEERGQGQAIAENLMEMMGLQTPIISVVIGEGGSGGALALAAADRVYMLENSVYSVIAPEGCANILWKDSKKVEEACDALHITAEDMKKFKVAEKVIPEDFDNFEIMCEDIKRNIVEDICQLASMQKYDMLESRYHRFRGFGIYDEE